jgi:hypothetical protein
MKPNNLWHYIEDSEQKGPVEKKRLVEQIAGGGLRFYFLGGISKVNTLMAAYKFVNDQEIRGHIEPHPEGSAA